MHNPGLIIVFVTLIGFGAFKVIEGVKENTNYDAVITKVQTNEVVITALGSPVEQNGIGSYSIKINNSKRTASATIPIKGSLGKGKIYVTTSGKRDNPTYEQLEVYINDTEQTINLLSLTKTNSL